MNPGDVIRVRGLPGKTFRVMRTDDRTVTAYGGTTRKQGTRTFPLADAIIVQANPDQKDTPT